MEAPHEGTARSVEVPTSECLGLLSSVNVGRIAWVHDDVPHILPVNHRVQNDRVVIRTGTGSALAAQAVGSSVAFEVDNVNFWDLTGWSVVLNGTCRVLDDERMRDLAASSLTPWVEGSKATVLTIDTVSITGRRLVAADPEGDN